MKRVFRFLSAALLPLAVFAQVGPEPGITRQQADEMLKELRQIRQLLEKQGAREPDKEQVTHAKLKLDGFEMLGSKDAPYTIVEFTDYQCPFCQRFHVTAYPELKKNYIDTGKVRFYSRDLPLDIHSNALRAAQAARCAGDQGKDQFWRLRDIMGANPDRLDLNNILTFAEGLKLNTGTLKTCIESEKYKNAVQTDVLEAMKIGANATPTFVVGKSTPEGVDGELLVGAMPYPMFQVKLEGLSK